MVSSTSAIDAAAAPSVDEQFLDLVCDNTDLLGAEFDAIIAAEWPTRPVDRLGVLTACRHPGDGAVRWVVDIAHVPTRPRHPGIGGWARQRSPPRSNGRPTDLTQKAGDRQDQTSQTRGGSSPRPHLSSIASDASCATPAPERRSLWRAGREPSSGRGPGR
jgi:hypothetical protein